MSENVSGRALRITSFLWVALAAFGVAGPAAAAEETDPLSDQAVEQRIRRHRTAEVALRVLDDQGRPLADAAVTVRQVRHKFLFGCNMFLFGRAGDPQRERDYRRRFDDLLNYATLPFYWGGYERRPGETGQERLEEMARWAAGRGIRTKGHPLIWHEVTPRWLRERSPEEVRRLQLGRVQREVEAFEGLVGTWDVVNEVVVMPEYQRDPDNPISALCREMGRVELVSRAFAEARRANPGAYLLLNDYNTSPQYERVLRQCLEAGVSIDAIGIQSHMHRGYWGAERAWEVCERFAQFGKPLHFTELTIVSGKLKTWQGFDRRRDWESTAEGEAHQAEQVRELYRVLFSHPAVEAITWWDFSDRGAWQGAPAGLVRADMSPKPAYEELMKLVRGAWWTEEVALRTDSSGRAAFRGFLGDYRLEAGDASASFAVSVAGRQEVTVDLKRRAE